MLPDLPKCKLPQLGKWLLWELNKLTQIKHLYSAWDIVFKQCSHGCSCDFAWLTSNLHLYVCSGMGLEVPTFTLLSVCCWILCFPLAPPPALSICLPLIFLFLLPLWPLGFPPFSPFLSSTSLLLIHPLSHKHPLYLSWLLSYFSLTQDVTLTFRTIAVPS